MPGSRCARGRIALKTWVTARTPRSNAACASAAVAFVWPSETTMPRAWRRSTRSSAPGSSGASVTSRTRPAARSRSSSAGSGSRRAARRCVPSRAAREERALEVDAEDPRPGEPRSGTARDRGDEVGLLGGDQRRQVGRDAGLEQRLAGGRESVGVRAEEVDAREPVHLQVDEAGHGDPATVALEADGLRSGRRRSRRRPGRGGRRRAQPRRRASRPERLSHDAAGAGRARSRAVAASIAARAASRSRPSRRRRTRRAPPSTSVGRRSGGELDDPPDAGAELRRSSRRRRPSGSRTSCPRRIIETVEIMLSTSFCAVPGLEPGRAGEHLRADDDRDLVVGERAERRSRRRRRRATVSAPARAQPRRARRGRTACGRSR